MTPTRPTVSPGFALKLRFFFGAAPDIKPVPRSRRRKRSVALPSSPPVLRPVESSLLGELAYEIRWAHGELLNVLQEYYFFEWYAFDKYVSPSRTRLARALILSRTLDLSDELAAVINGELESLWGALTRMPQPTGRRCRRVLPVKRKGHKEK